MNVTVNGISLYYRVEGSGAVPLVLLHGNGESEEIFASFRHALQAALPGCFRVWSFDSRGQGQSQKGVRLSYRLMAEDIDCAIRILGIDNPVVLGFSDGAIVALMMGARLDTPMRKIIACGPNLSPRGLKFSVRVAGAVGWMLTRNPLLKMMIREPDLKESELDKIGIPVLVTGGAHDMIRRRELVAIADALPQGMLKILPGEGHSSYITDGEKLLDAVKEFLLKDS